MNYLLILLLIPIPIATSRDDPELKFEFFTPRPDWVDPTTEKEVPSKVIDESTGKIIPKVEDILGLLPNTENARQHDKLKIALENENGKIIKGLNENLNSQDNSLTSCPHVEAKLPEVCAVAGSEPICWSPGTHDVDCPTKDSQNPYGLCCFDGCQNSCLKTCKTVLENVTTVKVVTKCHQFTREVCEPKVTKICHQKCCRDKIIKECRDLETEEEVCTTEELTKNEHPTECPTPNGTPTDCINDCWSPGVDDVDCPTGNDTRPFGLCCFNGCANKCLKKPCVPETAVATECNPAIEPECKEIETTVCKKITRQTIPKSCDKIETEECRTENSAQKVCFKSGCGKKTICEPVAPVEKCETEYIEKCDYVPTYSMGHKKGIKSKGWKTKGWKSKGHYKSKSFKAFKGNKAKSYIHKGLAKRSAEPWGESLKGDWELSKGSCWKGHSLKGWKSKALKSKGHFKIKGYSKSKGFKALNGTKAKSDFHKGLAKRSAEPGLGWSWSRGFYWKGHHDKGWKSKGLKSKGHFKSKGHSKSKGLKAFKGTKAKSFIYKGFTKRSAEPWWGHSLKGDWDSSKGDSFKAPSWKGKGHSFKGWKSKGHFKSKGHSKSKSLKAFKGTKAKSYIHKGFTKRSAEPWWGHSLNRDSSKGFNWKGDSLKGHSWKGKGHSWKGKGRSWKGKGHSWKGKGHHKSKGWKGWKGEQAGTTQCFLTPVEKCTLIPQDPICKEIEIEPVEKCEAAIACESDESEICISSTIAEISQQCVEKCETVKENVCENKMVQKCEDVTTTICKLVQKCEKVPKVIKECRERKDQECKNFDQPIVNSRCEEKCSETTKEVCRQEPFEQCNPVEEEVVTQVPKEVCF